MLRYFRSLFLLSFVSFFLILSVSDGLAAKEGSSLPVRKVILYKNGLGYFQHLGGVSADERVEIVLPSSQLDDVLKSLTVLDLGGGSIGAVTYDSLAPLERRLGELPIDLSESANLIGFLNQIRGSAVEVDAPNGKIVGRLLSSEQKVRVHGPQAVEQVVQVSIFTPEGALKVVELESVGSLRLAEKTLSEDINRYLDVMSSASQRDVRRLSINTNGSSARDLFVSYIAEAPIWKTTYRLVLDEQKEPLLQGWAIVDNTTPMDWSDVELSLVAGAPVSFVQKLSEPVYGRRPVVPLPEGVQVTPQAHDGAVFSPQQQLAELRLEEPMEAMAGGARMRPIVAAKRALSSADMAMSAAPEMAPPSPAPPPLGEAIRNAVSSVAEGAVLGDLFEYKLGQRVSIGKNQSALLPIIQSKIDVEKVSLFNESDGQTRPRLAVWLKNSSGLTLDGGALSVVDDSAFAGEGLIETVQPGEQRLVSYALDLGVEVTTKHGSEGKKVERIVARNGVMRMIRKFEEKRTYSIRNNAEGKRTLLIEHPVRSGWKLSGSQTPAEVTANVYRFKVPVGAKTSDSFVVTEERPLETVYQLTDITPQQVGIWVRERTIDPALEKELSEILKKKAEMDSQQRKLAALDEERERIFRDQERVRENLGRLGMSPDEARLRQRYVSELEAEEDRIGQIESEAAAFRVELDRLGKEFQLLIEKLEFDRSL